VSEAETSGETPKAPGYLEIAERTLVDFFGAGTTGESAAFLRIGFGLLAIWTSVGVWLNLDRYFGNWGLVPWATVKDDDWVWLSAFSLAPDARWMLLLHAGLFTAASVLYMLGLFPRSMGLLIGYINLSLQARNPFILNSGDRLFMIVAPLTALMPLDRHWSIAALVRRVRGKPMPPPGTVLGLRLVQLELAYVYMASFVAKAGAPRWRAGIALRDVLSSPVFAEWPRYWSYFPIIVTLSYMTLVFEGTFPLLVWWKRCRPWMLIWGVLFHIGIDAMMIIPMFSWVMIVCYPAFLTDDETRWLARKLFR
jgi:hypothetical protein